MRQMEVEKALTDLGDRIEDWKGYNPEFFGPLLIFGTLEVIAKDVDGERSRRKKVSN